MLRTKFILIICVYGVAAKSCWWSLCQTQSWSRKGCQPQHLYYEAQSKSCNGGITYQCCPLPIDENNVGDKIGPDFNFVEAPEDESGLCSWYGSGDVSQGSPTASGEKFNKYSMKAAHKTLPFGTKIRVTNSKSKKTVDVTINDRGPFMPGRILDLTFAAFGAVENRDKGLFRCSYTVLSY